MDLANVYDGVSFENYIQQVFLSNNIPALTTPTTNDYGADLIVKYKGQTISVQCKYYTRPVGVKAVQEVMASLKFYDARYGMVVTNSMFSQQAHNLAETNNILLIDGSVSLERLSDYLDDFIGNSVESPKTIGREEPSWTAEDLIIRYGVSKATLLKNYLGYGLPYRKVGREYRFNKKQVVDWEIRQRYVPFGRNRSIPLPGFVEHVQQKRKELEKAKQAGDLAAVREIKEELKRCGGATIDSGLVMFFVGFLITVAVVVTIMFFSKIIK